MLGATGVHNILYLVQLQSGDYLTVGCMYTWINQWRLRIALPVPSLCVCSSCPPCMDEPLDIKMAFFCCFVLNALDVCLI